MHETVIMEVIPQCKCGANIDRVKTEVRLLSENQMIRTIYCRECGHIFTIADASADLATLRKKAKDSPLHQQYYDKLLQEYQQSIGKAEGEAEAYRQRKLVEAGLSPKERAEFDMRTKIGVAEALAKVNLPKVVMSGNTSGNNTAMDAVGLKMMNDLVEKMSK